MILNKKGHPEPIYKLTTHNKEVYFKGYTYHEWGEKAASDDHSWFEENLLYLIPVSIILLHFAQVGMIIYRRNYKKRKNNKTTV